MREERSPLESEPSSLVRTYAELVRLPNLFTAMADVVMGFLITHPEFASDDAKLLGLLMAASTALYAAGVVLNDVFDASIDAQERPERPIPSGRVSLAAARWLGAGLLLLGIGLGVAASVASGSYRPGLVAAVLASGVVLYDGALKRTPLGPLGMGACRVLNVFLGMSLSAVAWQPAYGWAMAGLGLYVAGITWFARSEAERSSRVQLSAASAVILAGIGLVAMVPRGFSDAVRIDAMIQYEPWRWTMLMVALALFTGGRCLWAILDPDCDRVQLTVTRLIHTLVFLDAAVCFVVWGVPGAVAVLCLLFPALFLGRWLYST